MEFLLELSKVLWQICDELCIEIEDVVGHVVPYDWLFGCNELLDDLSKSEFLLEEGLNRIFLYFFLLFYLLHWFFFEG